MPDSLSPAKPTWSDLLGAEKQKDYFRQLMQFVANERAEGYVIYPPEKDVFNAFTFCEAHEVKVVIIGQDPYHGPQQAHGLCFSVLKGNKIPPSLRNIYKELANDIPDFKIPQHGELSAWAEQGVLLLNTVLTVRDAQAHSHKNKGWEQFTDTVIAKVSDALDGLVFLLWGAPAQKKASLIDTSKHSILKAAHPSPLSAHRGFLGCKHFSQVNAILAQQGKQAINWQV
uniref:uracil-DNA glycosylase n=1 Tax=Ningiella ruwaisensis TaxID=2364274 RepID=UPI00109F04E0|nr:uracil-DNA glycosylase [Ningiella ruwaisensis]